MWRVTVFILLIAAQAVAIVPDAGAAGASPQGSAGIRSGAGFDCGGGLHYEVRDGVARCSGPASTSTPGVSCTRTTFSQGMCSFTFPASTSGTTAVASNAKSGYAGNASGTCSNGRWIGEAATCQPNGCSAATHAFGACSFNVPAMSSGQYVDMPNFAAGYTGSSRATCNAGSLSFSGESCNALPQPCAGGTIGWMTYCDAAISSSPDGQSLTLSNAVAGYSGRATFTCSNGTWTGPFSASCSAAPPPACPSEPATTQTVSCEPGYTGVITQARTGTCDSSTGWAWQMEAWAVRTNTCQPIVITPPPACPATILVRSTKVPIPLVNATPSDTLPNGHAYCLYELDTGDKQKGVFDLVQNRAVDVVPVFSERYVGLHDQQVGAGGCAADDPTSCAGYYQVEWDSVMQFDHYEYDYWGTDNAIQGAYCANGNNGTWPDQSGKYPGTCYTGGHGRFSNICKLQLSPTSLVGKQYAALHALMWGWAGGDTYWGAYHGWVNTSYGGPLGSYHLGGGYRNWDTQLAQFTTSNIISNCQDGAVASWVETPAVYPPPPSGP